MLEEQADPVPGGVSHLEVRDERRNFFRIASMFDFVGEELQGKCPLRVGGELQGPRGGLVAVGELLDGDVEKVGVGDVGPEAKGDSLLQLRSELSAEREI